MTRIMTNNLSDLYKATIGFDDMFSEMERVFTASTSTGYPPYNIAKLDETTYLISLAVAGFDMSNLEITQEGTKLLVAGTAPKLDETVEYLHKGIAGRSFQREFHVAEHVEVTGAKLELGVLNIELKRNIPEELLPRKINIV